MQHFKKSEYSSQYENIHMLNFDHIDEKELSDLLELKKKLGDKKKCILLFSQEPKYYYPKGKVSKQWIEFKDLLLKYQIFNCDFFISSFLSDDNLNNINYLNQNYYDWKFYDFPLDMLFCNYIGLKQNENLLLEVLEFSKNISLEECTMKFSHLNFTHRMHRQIFSKFLIRENLTKNNLISINPFRSLLEQQEYRINPNYKQKAIIEANQNDSWFYNKNLLDMWRNVPLKYSRHPLIDEKYDHIFLSFLKKTSFNIISETVFNYPVPFCTEKTMQSLFSIRPFIMIGSCKNLQHLRNKGFKTFHSIIDESYDNIEDPNKRLEAVMQLVLELNKKSQKELNDMVYAVKDILIHNSSLMLEKIRKFINIEK